MTLKELRYKSMMTQKELSEKCGISPVLYSHLENGRRKVTPTTAKKLSTVFNVHWSELYDMLNKN